MRWRAVLGSVSLLSKVPLLFCSFVLSRVSALTLALGSKQRLKFLRCRLSFILRDMGIEILPWLCAGRPEIGRQLQWAGVVQTGGADRANIRVGLNLDAER